MYLYYIEYLDIYYLHKYLEYLPIFIIEEKNHTPGINGMSNTEQLIKILVVSTLYLVYTLLQYLV